MGNLWSTTHSWLPQLLLARAVQGSDEVEIIKRQELVGSFLLPHSANHEVLLFHNLNEVLLFHNLEAHTTLHTKERHRNRGTS